MEIRDVYWLAGILEGEGYFRYIDGAGIALQMTDKDIVDRVAKLFDSPVLYHKSKNLKHKDVYSCRVYGQRAVDIMIRILPIMGIRRSEVIRSIIFKHNNRTNTWSNKRKLSDDNIREIKKLLLTEKVSDIATKYNVHRQCISDIRRGKSGKNIA